jgi:truncated hemoglobin YjbI/plastocyanin
MVRCRSGAATTEIAWIAPGDAVFARAARGLFLPRRATMKKLSVCLLLFGCAHSAAPQSASPPPATAAAAAAPAAAPGAPATLPPLFVRLGGHDAVVAVVHEFVVRNVTDKRVKQRFFNTDAAHLEAMLVEFVTTATGGPGGYSGRDMPSSHVGMELVAEEFDAVVENLKGALDKFHVPAREENELLGALGPLEPQIIAKPETLKPIDAAQLAAVVKIARSLPAGDASDLLTMAVTAGGRGQRSYAEQLFSRAELLLGTPKLASVAATFRAGSPPRIEGALAHAASNTPQPKTAVGNSDEDEPAKVPARGSLRGVLRVEGKPLGSFGVVMLEPIGGSSAHRAPKHRVLEQRDRQFAPRVMAVPVGSTVAFPNFDSVFHNVFSLSDSKPFDLGLYKNGDMREVKFDKEGIIMLGCNLHSSMSAYLVVVSAPHYAVTGAGGTFYFRSLPPGKYRVKAWSDRSSTPTLATVEIKAGSNQTGVDLDGTAPMAVNTDKFGAPRGPAHPEVATAHP